MTYVTDCPDHAECSLIVSEGWPDTAGSWVSHFANDVAPEARLNPGDPAQASVADRRAGAAAGATLSRRPPNAAERERLDGTRPPRLVGNPGQLA